MSLNNISDICSKMQTFTWLTELCSFCPPHNISAGFVPPSLMYHKEPHVWAYNCDRETVLTYSLQKIRIYRHAVKYHQYPKHSGIDMLTFPRTDFPIFHRCVYLYMFIKVYVMKIIIILYRLFCNLFTN